MTYYEILGVPRTANCAEIKKAYRNLAMKYHPDITGKNTGDKFKKIKDIYEILVDPDKRKLYDDSIRSDLVKLNDYISRVTISVDESIRGCIKKFSYYYNVPCTCGTNKLPCNTCKGKGFIRNFADHIKTCPTCDGHKFSNSNNCRLCFGSGEIRKYASSEINLPPGIYNSKLKCIVNNIEVIIEVNVVKSSTDIYERNGNDLIYKVKIDPITSLIGGKLYIPTLSGYSELNIRENSKSEQLYKMPSNGIPNTNGSLYIIVNVDNSMTDLSLIPKIRDIVYGNK